MATMEELKNDAHSPSLVWKGLEGVAFIGPEDAEVIDAITDTTRALTAVPAGYLPIGLVSKDGGYTFGSETETSDVPAHGYAQPVRTDITSQVKSVTATLLEALNRQALELAHGADLSAVQAAADNAEITWDDPDRPAMIYRRLLVIAKDKDATETIYRGKFFPRVSVTDFPEEVWNETDPSQFEITFTPYVDDALGTACRNFIAGPGLTTERLALMGFEQAV